MSDLRREQGYVKVRVTLALPTGSREMLQFLADKEGTSIQKLLSTMIASHLRHAIVAWAENAELEVSFD